MFCFAHIFQVAFERFSRSRNQAFCSAPRIVCGGRRFQKLGISTLPSAERIVAGGFPPLYVRAASRISIACCGIISGKPALERAFASSMSVGSSARPLRWSVMISSTWRPQRSAP
jgi:hypothetical protein